jgi:hypothetical protein
VVETVNPVILLVKTPVPVPSDVLVLNATVAPELVLQQTPRAVTAEPPSVDIFPPEDAVVLVIEEIAVVVSVGIFACAVVVNDNSCP